MPQETDKFDHSYDEKTRELTFPNLGQDGVTFSKDCILIRRAEEMPSAEKWKGDYWKTRIYLNRKHYYPRIQENTCEIDYYTGIGQRKNFRPVPPSIKNLLICIASDCGALLEMPRDEYGALDYFQSELGYKAASKALRVYRTLQENYVSIQRILTPHRIGIETFIEIGQVLDQ